MRIEFVFSRKWTLQAGEALAAIAASDRAPELLCELVDGVVMTNEIWNPCKALCAPWPVAGNPFILCVLARVVRYCVVSA